MQAAPPTSRRLVQALRLVRATLGEPCYAVDGGEFRFRLSGPWSLAISPESAGRLRVSACHRGTPVATLWCLASDRDRLADLALAAQREATALVAS